MKQILKIAVATLAMASFATIAQAEGDAAKGEAFFKKKCKLCHKIGPKAKKGVGPALNNIVGATAGTLGTKDKYKYSKAMAEAGKGGLKWDEETLDKFLTKPKDVVPKTKMKIPLPGGGVKEAADRANIIAFLKSHTKMEKKP